MGAPDCALFDLYRGSTHDGPGMRAVAFFKGCPLRCGWCHNPEGIPSGPAVWYDASSCIGCGLCGLACPSGALEVGEEGLVIHRERCTACGSCAAECPSVAMSRVDRPWGLEELTEELCRDEAYYRSFGGGVTASGGEPLLQAEAVAALFARLRARGVHTALDTSGAAPLAALEEVLPHTDCVLWDLKLADGAASRELIGMDSAPIMDNFLSLLRLARDRATPPAIWVRTPLIPGATATGENLRAIGEFLAREAGDLLGRWELCAFNNSCAHKYRKLGLDWPYEGQPLLTARELDHLRREALGAGLNPALLVVSGLSASTDETESTSE